MADFAEIGEIISRCMGYENNKFIDAYYKNIDLQVEEAIAVNHVASAITKFMEELENKTRSPITLEEGNNNWCCLLWRGTNTGLLAELDGIENSQIM